MGSKPGTKPTTNQDTYFYDNQNLSQFFVILNNFLYGQDALILVIGEKGSGKTTMLNRFLASTREDCRGQRIRSSEHKNLNQRFVYTVNSDKLSTLIMDDAHELNATELRLLCLLTKPPDIAPKFKQLIMFSEPGIMTTLSQILKQIPNTSVHKIYIPHLTLEQTFAYIQHQLQLSGYKENKFFTSAEIKTIHKASRGLPGLINKRARALILKKSGKYKKNKPRFGFLLNRIFKRFRLHIAVLLIILVAGFFILQQYTGPVGLI